LTSVGKRKPDAGNDIRVARTMIPRLKQPKARQTSTETQIRRLKIQAWRPERWKQQCCQIATSDH